jgi:hypothetical protein
MTTVQDSNWYQRGSVSRDFRGGRPHSSGEKSPPTVTLVQFYIPAPSAFCCLTAWPFFSSYRIQSLYGHSIQPVPHLLAVIS